jgi:hypothetical protein
LSTLPRLAQGVPVFFLSYGRTHRGGSVRTAERAGFDDKVLRFFDGLSEHVRQLVGSRMGAVPGFVDQSIRAGEEWEQVILEKVRTAPVFVALISADYVDSEWCGKEWDAFSRRRPERVEGEGGSYQTTILPVIWSPLPRFMVPKVVQRVQRFAPRVEASRAYINNGIYGLLSAGESTRADYEAVVWELAMMVATYFHNFDVPDGLALSADDLRNVFDGRRPGEPSDGK